MEPATSRTAFHLGDWLVEPSLNRVSRGLFVRHLRPRLMDLLVFLAARPGEVVTKDQILAGVWRQAYVAESVLSRSVADLRQVLEDQAERPRFIETIPKRGYRLVARVEAAGGRGGVALPFAAPAAPPDAAARPSIVVLPFVDMAPGHDQEYFCDGLAEELTNALAQLPGLRVVARTSAFAFKNRPADVREIGRVLGVAVVLEGGVQRAGDRLRVTVQLIDVADGCHICSRRFDGVAGDLFAVEDQIVRDVVSVLRVRLIDGRNVPAVAGRTVNPAAHDLYLKGRHLSARRSPAALAAALPSFEQAVAIDPGYAAAHAAIAEVHAVSGFVLSARPRDVIPLARKAAERSLAIHPNLAEGHAVLGHVSGMFEWNWAEAESHFSRALEISPGYALARVWYSHPLTASGRFEEAIGQTERACECDPLSPTVQMTLGLSLFYARSFDRAARCYLDVLERAPSFSLARFQLGRLRLTQGRLEEAVEQFEQAADTTPVALGFLAGVFRLLGRHGEAAAVVARLEELAKLAYLPALAWLGTSIDDPEARLAALERSLDEHEGPAPLLNVEPGVDDLRDHPRFQAMVARLDLPRVFPARAAWWPSAAGRSPGTPDSLERSRT